MKAILISTLTTINENNPDKHIIEKKNEDNPFKNISTINESNLDMHFNDN